MGVGRQGAMIVGQEKSGTGHPDPALVVLSYRVVLVTPVTVRVAIDKTLSEVLRIQFATT